jgi:phosphatidate phosphatase APP1
MNRPYLVNFSAILSDSKISIKANLTVSNTIKHEDAKRNKSSTPFQSIKLFSKNPFTVKVKGISSGSQTLFDKDYDTDDYGNFELTMPEKIDNRKIKNLILYEVSHLKGIQVHLGSIIPTEVKVPKKIVISDFDKTLVETKYSTLTEVYYSLNRPLNHFPTILPSLQILKDYMANGHQPFILSASPHFYENAIRDWLYQNDVFASSIFLKDYRDFISVFNGELSTKDLKKHGFYKLNQLVEILLMTGIPKELVLIGDGFESDPFIYLTLRSLLVDRADPWKIWKSIKNDRAFNLNSKQDSFFLTKFYRLAELSKKEEIDSFNIYIRATSKNIEKLKKTVYKNQFINNGAGQVNYYIG